MQNLVRSKTIGVTGNGGKGTAGAGPGRDLLYIHTKSPKWSGRTSFTTRWNVNGALQRPKGITTHSKARKLFVKGGFLDIFVVDSDLVEPTNKADLRKYGGTPLCTQDGLDRW